MVWDPDTYDEPRKRLVPDFDAFYGTAAQLVARQQSRSLTVLDLGAGTGILSERIAEISPQASLTLIDGSQEMLAIAQRRLTGRNAVFLTSRLEEPLPGNGFDAVVSALSIHHLNDDDKRKLFEMILASLNPGGIFVNADQYAGPTTWHDIVYREMHETQSRSLGSDDREWEAAVERMTQRRAIEPGTFIFVAAGQVHRFEEVSPDFAAWVFFYGPQGGEAPG